MLRIVSFVRAAQRWSVHSTAVAATSRRNLCAPASSNEDQNAEEQKIPGDPLLDLDIASTVRAIVEEEAGGQFDGKDVDAKCRILLRCINTFVADIPSPALDRLQSEEALVQFFENERARLGQAIEDDEKPEVLRGTAVKVSDLPPNMHFE